jgi:hypothetical protein
MYFEVEETDHNKYDDRASLIDDSEDITPTQPFDDSEPKRKRIKITSVEVEKQENGDFTLAKTDIVLEGVGDTLEQIEKQTDPDDSKTTVDIADAVENWMCEKPDRV